MPLDLAIDYNTGDLVIAPNKDLDVRTGMATIEQRIRVRLRMRQGEWLLDTSGGTLGSTLHDATRQPTWRAVQEIPLIVKEALAPMGDISVRDVAVDVDVDDPRMVHLTIAYSILDAGPESEEQTLAFTTTIAG